MSETYWSRFRKIRRFVIKIIIALSLMVTIGVISSDYCNAQNSNVSWSSFNMGFAESKTSNTMMKSVVGQNFVGTSQQVNTQVISGFLADTLFRSFLVDVKEPEGLPGEYSLAQNYPNPFNPSTTIHFELPKESHVTLKVYNMLGQEVLTVLDEQKVAGRYDLKISAEGGSAYGGGASRMASGVYFYRLAAGEYMAVKKFILLK